VADATQIKEITAKLETGLKELFESGRYADYLRIMSRFHNYSSRNVLLIAMQMPAATRVAGYQTWIKKFGRKVKRGEHGIKIFAPTAFTVSEEKEKLDPISRRPVLDENGMPVFEQTERTVARFKVTTVFDVSQTDGEPLPALAEMLTGDVARYDLFMDALRAVSPLPIVFEELPENTDGRCYMGDRIAIREGMSEVQTVSAVIHEITHAKLHDRTNIIDDNGEVESKDRRTEEVEAESVSFVVNNYYGIDTGALAVGYIAEWSRDKELKELNTSLGTIRKVAAELIDGIDEQYRQFAAERGAEIRTAAVDEPNQTSNIDGSNAPLSTERDTMEHRNYETFAAMFPKIASGEYGYLRLESGGLEPLSIEWIGDGRISVMHTYTMNGDLMYDPMMEFEIDNDAKTMNAVAYEQSMPPLNQYIGDEGIGRSYDGNGNETTVRNLQIQLNEFAAQWLENIGINDYTPVRAIAEINGQDTELLFDDDDNTTSGDREKPRTPVGYLAFKDSGEVVTYYAADEMLAAYKREIESIGPENVRYRGVTDEDLEQKLYAAYTGECG
jgi:antirestriction protein ArdC